MRLTVGRPNLPRLEDFIRHAVRIWDSGMLTNNGPFVRELEIRIEDYLCVEHCVLVANGTLGLEVAARALGLTGEVIMPSWTFVATAHALSWIGLKPVFADVDGHHISPDHVRSLITEKTSAIVGVHTWGKACDVEKLDRIAVEHDLKIIYDAAHAFGCSQIGNFRDCEVFSFHATKFFGTFEGGAITTNDPELARRCRRLRTFGFEDNVVVDIGTNAKMSEIHAAMGLCMMDKLDSLVAINYHNYRLYKQRLGDMMVLYDEDERQNYQYIVIETERRDEIVEKLGKAGILARKYFHPGVHRIYGQKGLPETERLAERTLCLPTGPSVSESDITQICDIVEGVCRS